MFSEILDYNLFLDYFDSFSKAGIEGVNANDPLITKLDQVTETNKQVFYISDVILLDILYITKSVQTLFGIGPGKVPQGFFLTTTHLDDADRHKLVRMKLLTVAQEFYIQKQGTKFLSVNVRARNKDGGYFNALYQAKVFYSKVPYESVFFMLVITDVSRYVKSHKYFHFYNGDDPHFFRFPDEELLKVGPPFTVTEFKIIELIDEGLSSKEIAQKLFRSLHTINTHRSNIISKSGKHSFAEVINDLRQQGLI